MQQLQNLLSQPQGSNLQLGTVMINLLLSAVLALALGWHFVRFGSTFSNRRKFAQVLPAIALTTTLVISIVKASLALSLGLVGALSIVRFRTPVKEPEELAYLFLAIAIGLGSGADQRLVTLAAIAGILAVLTVRSKVSPSPRHPNLFMNIEIPDAGNREGILRQLAELLDRRAPGADLRRFDVQGASVQATFYLDAPGADTLFVLQESLQTEYPGCAVTFVEQTGLPGA